MRKALITSCLVLAAVTLLLASAWLYRERLLLSAAAHILPGDQLTLTRLEGLELDSSRLGVAELEFLLPESRQRLVIADLDLDFIIDSPLRLPVLESLAIGSARLSVLDESPPEDSRRDDAGRQAGFRISAVLELLREFPLVRIAVDELRIPWRSEPLAVELERGDGSLVAIVASGPLELHARFAQAAADAEAHLQLALTRATASVGDIRLSLAPEDEAWALSGNGTLDIADLDALLGALEQAPAPFPLRAAQLDVELAGTVADDLGGVIAGTPQTFALVLRAGSRIVLPANLVDGLGEVELEASDAIDLAISSGAGRLSGSGRLPLRLSGNWRDEAASVDAVLQLADCGFALTAACALELDGSASLGMYALSGHISAMHPGNGAYELATSGLTLGGLPQWLPRFDVQARVQARGDSMLTLTATVRATEAPTPVDLALDAVYDPERRSAELHAVLPELVFMEEGRPLSAWFAAWPFTFDVLAGSVAAEASLAWQQGVLSGPVAIDLNELGGFHGDYFFRGLDGEVQANVDTSSVYPLALPPQTLSAAGLDVGLPMENLRLDFSFTHSGLLHVDAFTLDVLNGKVTGNDIAYDFTRERNAVLVEFAGLEIERMMDLVDYEGVTATGAVSGQLPLTLTPDGVEVAAGELHADAPGGSIRYVGAASGASGNAGLDLVQQALGNYRYDRLTSGIEYAPGGELLLSMKLEGHNPDMQNGQRINLNLNLSNNVPDLLESLQASRRIEDFLEEQYR